MGIDVFISYRREVSEDKARIIKSELTHKGYNVFLDYDSLRDGKYRENEETAIKDCRAFVLLLSDGTLDRCANQGDELAMEIRWAKKYDRHIIPVLAAESYTEPTNLPDDLRFIHELQSETYNGGRYFDPFINFLCDRINKIPVEKTLPQEMVDTLPQLHIATLGQKGHGKSLLTAAILNTLNLNGVCGNKITYKDLNNPGVCKFSNGHSVRMAQVLYNTLHHRYQHIDCLDHEDYDTILSNGLHEFDGAILVVDAQEGPMPQTREHILLAGKANIPHIVVYISNCDAVDDDICIDLVEMECRDILDFFGFDGDNTPIIRGSSLGAMSGDGRWTKKIEELLSKMDEWIMPKMHATQRPFLLRNIDDVCYLKGKGTVVHGEISAGTIRVGDVVTIPNTYPALTSSVDEILMFDNMVNQAEAGDTAHLLLPDIGIKEMDLIKRGMFIRKKLG